MNSRTTRIGTAIAVTMVLLSWTTVPAAPLNAKDTLATVLGLSDGDGCQGDPCAQTVCSSGSATADAVGSEHAWASATVGTDSASSDGPGAAHADAVGKGDSSASAKGKRDWSLKEANSECNREWTGSTTFNIQEVACIADDRIKDRHLFNGRLYQDKLQNLIAFDDSLGYGIQFSSPTLLINGQTFDGAEAFDVEQLSPINGFLSADMTNDEEAGISGCAVRLYQDPVTENH